MKMKEQEWVDRLRACEQVVGQSQHSPNDLKGLRAECQSLQRELARGEVTNNVEQAKVFQEQLNRLVVDVDRLEKRNGVLTGSVNKTSILQLQQQIFREQDQALDEISNQLRRVGHIGTHINDEVNLQNALLDDLERGVDTGHERVNALAQNAGKVAVKAGTCRLWITIILLMIVLIVLLVA